jgi:hypothetical protein
MLDSLREYWLFQHANIRITIYQSFSQQAI